MFFFREKLTETLRMPRWVPPESGGSGEEVERTHLNEGTGNPVTSHTDTAVVPCVISFIKLPSNLRPACFGGMFVTGSVKLSSRTFRPPDK